MKITAQVYLEIKKAFETGEVRSVSEGSRFWGISRNTMYRILNSKNFHEYHYLVNNNRTTVEETQVLPIKKRRGPRGPYKVRKLKQAAPVVLPKPTKPAESAVATNSFFLSVDLDLKAVQSKLDFISAVQLSTTAVILAILYFSIKGL